jgi:hypothetical protein
MLLAFLLLLSVIPIVYGGKGFYWKRIIRLLTIRKILRYFLLPMFINYKN